MSVNSFENYPMSWRPVLKKGTDPLYKRLANQLETDIADGILLPGTNLGVKCCNTAGHTIGNISLIRQKVYIVIIHSSLNWL